MEDYQKVFNGDELWLQILSNQKIRYLFVSKERHKELAGGQGDCTITQVPNRT